MMRLIEEVKVIQLINLLIFLSHTLYYAILRLFLCLNTKNEENSSRTRGGEI